MASSSTCALEVVMCDFCQNPTQRFCNKCQVSLCWNCINGHVDDLESLEHDIVPYKDKKEPLDYPSCAFHPKLKCQGHCQQCDIPVCIKCVTGSHNGHTFKDMDEIVDQMKEEILKETVEIEYLILIFALSEANMNQKISNMTDTFETMEREGENLRRTWHKEVDNIFNMLQSSIRKMKDRRLTVLSVHQTKLQESVKILEGISKNNKDILNSDKVSDVTNYKSNIEKFRDISADIDVGIPSLNINKTKGRELSIELGEYKATMTLTSISSQTDNVSVSSERKLLGKVKIIAHIFPRKMPFANLGPIVCIGATEAWLCVGDKGIRRFNIRGSIKNEFATERAPHPTDISLTRQGELIYSDIKNKTVNIVRRGRIETLITLPQGWHPVGLCCSKSGDLLVSMCTRSPDESHHKIVRYQGQTPMQEMDKDEHGQRIFKGGSLVVRVKENNNEDMCTADLNARTVIVMDKTGRVRFRYKGKPTMWDNPFKPSSRRDGRFNPAYLVTDSLSQIIICEFKNDCLHILHQSGQFLRYFDNCGLHKPTGMSVDNEGKLWVVLPYSGDLKVIQYLEEKKLVNCETFII